MCDSGRCVPPPAAAQVSLDDGVKAQCVVAMRDGGFAGAGFHVNKFHMPLSVAGVPLLNADRSPVCVNFTVEMNAFERGGSQAVAAMGVGAGGAAAEAARARQPPGMQAVRRRLQMSTAGGAPPASPLAGAQRGSGAGEPGRDASYFSASLASSLRAPPMSASALGPPPASATSSAFAAAPASPARAPPPVPAQAGYVAQQQRYLQAGAGGSPAAPAPAPARASAGTRSPAPPLSVEERLRVAQAQAAAIAQAQALAAARPSPVPPPSRGSSGGGASSSLSYQQVLALQARAPLPPPPRVAGAPRPASTGAASPPQQLLRPRSAAGAGDVIVLSDHE